ncbi:MAG: GntR family transcriptional regulator [Micrococcaceae bacterium]
MALTKIDPSSRVGDQVFDALLEAIVTGELPEGHRLRIRTLAEELGTSVMPVREALRRLEEVGVAEAEPYKGAVVKRFTAVELLNVYAVRRILEVEATRAGVSHIRNQELESVGQELRRMEAAIAAQNATEYLDRDESLLTIVYAAADNPVLVESIRSLWLRCRSYKLVGARREMSQDDASELSRFQRELLEAAVDRDVERAVAVTEASLDAAIERIRSAFAQE